MNMYSILMKIILVSGLKTACSVATDLMIREVIRFLICRQRNLMAYSGIGIFSNTVLLTPAPPPPLLL
jgi:hypothetical protein